VDWVEREVDTYLKLHEADPELIVVDFGATVANALTPSMITGSEIDPILRQIEPFLRTSEELSALIEPPSDGVLRAIRDKLRGRRRDRTRLRVFEVAAVVLFTLLVAASVFAVLFWFQSKTARSRELAASALSQLQNDPSLSTVLAYQAAQTHQTTEAVSALRQSLEESPDRAILTYGAPGFFADHDHQVFHADYSPDGRRALTATYGGEVRIWELSSGRVEAKLMAGTLFNTNDPTPKGKVAFSPNGKNVVTASNDGTVQIWDSYTGERLKPLKLEKTVFHAEFSSDGKQVVASGPNCQLVLWEWQSDKITPLDGCASTDVADNHNSLGEPVTSNCEHKPGVTRDIFVATFSGNGLVAAGSGDCRVRVWDVGTKTLHVCLGIPRRSTASGSVLTTNSLSLPRRCREAALIRPVFYGP
jgi:hypothetical protein